MAKSRKEKNQKIYAQLEEEMKNSKESNYEEKLKNIDPKLSDSKKNEIVLHQDKNIKKNETKSNSSLTVIAKKVNGEKTSKKNELVVVKKEKKVSKKENADIVEDFDDPISYTDKLSVEEILRAKIEQQERIKAKKKIMKKSPNNESYTPEMMQERIKQNEGVDVRKEVKLVNKNYVVFAIGILVLLLTLVVVLGLIIIFNIAK